MKYIVILALALSGCSTVVPVTQKWPPAPGLQSTQPCAELQRLDPKAQLSDVARVVTDNYLQYHVCAVKLEAWQEWYQQQKIIFEGLR